MKKILIIFLALSGILLSADENFKWSLENGRILLDVANRCYLYSEQLKIDGWDEKNEKLRLILPKGVKYNDEFSGETLIIPAGKYIIGAENKVLIQSAVISYQGCKAADADESGICFMPQRVVLGKKSPVESDNVKKEHFLDDFNVVGKYEGTMNVDEMAVFLDGSNVEGAEKTSDWWADKSVFFILFLLLSGGFLLNFTPCILPLIPINLAIIGAGGAKTPLAGLLRGIYYAVGMICAYGALGIAAIVSGMRFGELNSSAYFNFAVAVIFFLLALAMAGVWNLDFSAKLNSINPMKWKVGRPIAIFFMGATAALLGGACVAPAVIGMILLAVSLYKTSPAAGLAVPFVFGAGMGILWIIAGATMGKVLPKPGKWMVYVKNFLAVVIGLFGVYYTFIAITLVSGRFNAADEVAKLRNACTEAAQQDKKIFIDFWASWCKNCSYMDKNVLENRQIKDKLSEYVTVKFQAEDLKDDAVAEILEKYQIQGLPAFVILEKKR